MEPKTYLHFVNVVTFKMYLMQLSFDIYSNAELTQWNIQFFMRSSLFRTLILIY